MSRHAFLYPFLLILAVYLAAVSWFATCASESYNMVWAFDCDEAGVLEDLIKMFRARSYAPLNYIYGTLHEYLALTAMLTLAAFRRVTEQDGILILRLISTAAGAGILVIMFRSAVRASLPLAGMIAVILLLSAKGFLFYCFNGKPEILQIVFLMLSLYLLGRAAVSGRWRWYFFSGIGAGLAFTVKFTGVMLLPLALTIPFINGNPSPADGRGRIFLAVKGCAAMVCGFAAAVVLTSPFMVRDAAVIAVRLAKASEVNREGFLFSAGKNFTEWLQILFNPSLLGFAGLIGLALLVFVLLRRKKEPPVSEEERALLCVHGAWCLLFCLYLFVGVNFRPERFILPVVPSFALLAGLAVGRSLSGRLFSSRPAKAVLVFMLLAGMAPNLVTTAGMIDSRLGYRETSRVMAGIWLEENVSAEAVIASDYLTYVPVTFGRQLRTSLLTSRDVMLANPDFIVINKESSSWFQDIGKAKSFAEGEGAYMLHYLLYHGLAKDEFPGYVRLKDFEEVTIYRRKGVAGLE